MRNDMIRFYCGEENGIVEEKKDYSESFFREQYVQAIRLFDHHLAYIQEDIPKVVAFCGERGEGKTSCMKSFTNLVRSHEVTPEAYSANDNSSELEKFCKGFSIECNTLKAEVSNLYWLPMVDPAFFDNTHNILELIVGRMYNDFINDKGNVDDLNQRRDREKLEHCFGEVKNSLTQLDKGRVNAYDPLEALDDLSVGVELKKRLDNLFSKFSQYKHKTKIVLTIDDIDLNVIGAYEMVEEIRKYLTGQFCLLLISLKVDQLIEVVSNYFRSILKRISMEESENMATHYVNKLIPQGFRITMPKVYDICDQELVVYNGRSDKKGELYTSVKEAVVKLIFTKTRYLYYNSKGSVSPIVPNNLRLLVHLLGMLLDMKDIYMVAAPDEEEALQAGDTAYEETIDYDVIVEKNEEIDKDILGSNKRKFKNYFYNTWAKQLRKTDRIFVERLLSHKDTIGINKLIVEHLTGQLPPIEQMEKDSNQTMLVKAITAPSNYDYNVSVGDVFYLIDFLERSKTSHGLQLLLFFLKSYYSIQLYETYDVITEKVGEFSPVHDPKKGEIFKSDPWFSRANSMQRLVNGALYTYAPTDVLPRVADSESDDNFRDRKIIRGEGLHKLMKKVKSQMEQYDIPTEQENAMNPEEAARFEEDFRTCEFFVMTIVTSKTRKEADKKNFWITQRAQSTPESLTDFNGYAGYYLLDVLAPFTNVMNLKFAYSRFESMRKENRDDDSDEQKEKSRSYFYLYALEHDFSLLNSMMKQVWLKVQKDNDEEYRDEVEENTVIAYEAKKDKASGLKQLMSNAIIRNAEVLTSVYEGIARRRTRRFAPESNAALIAFYKELQDSAMRTYPTTSDDQRPYIIRFGFLKAFMNFLSTVPSTWASIYETGVERRVVRTDDIEWLFAKTFDFVKSFREGKNIKANIHKHYPDLYEMQALDQWNILFPDTARINRNKMKEKLASSFADEAARRREDLERKKQAIAQSPVIKLVEDEHNLQVVPPVEPEEASNLK